MGIPIGELKERMTISEFRQWTLFRKAYGPFGYERTDYNFAQIVASIQLLIQTVVAVAGGNNSGEPITIQDALLKFEPVKQSTVENNVNEAVKSLKNLTKTVNQK